MKTIILSRTVVLLVATVTAASGCTGYLIGYAIDLGSKEVITPSGPSAPALEMGKTVTVVLDDGEKVKGKYRGLEQLSETEYAELYSASRESLMAYVQLPALGDTVDLLLYAGDTVKAGFLGCDLNGVVARPVGGADTERVEAVEIRELLGDGSARASGMEFRLLASEGRLPIRTALALEWNGASRLVPLNRVARIERTPTTARWIGFTAEAVLTAAYIAILAATWDDYSW